MSSAKEVDSNGRTMRLIAGFGLLLMAILAGWSNFAVFESEIVDGDSLATATNMIDSAGLFRAGILAFVIVGLLDVIVAWALNEVLRDGARALSSLAAVLRYVYAGILLIAAGFLVMAMSVASPGVNADSMELTSLHMWLDGFSYTWDIGLFLFAFHLMVLGYAIEKAKIAKAWVGLGWVVMIAGAGYLFDAIAVIMDWDIGFEFGAFLFNWRGDLAHLADMDRYPR